MLSFPYDLTDTWGGEDLVKSSADDLQLTTPPYACQEDVEGSAPLWTWLTLPR